MAQVDMDRLIATFRNRGVVVDRRLKIIGVTQEVLTEAGIDMPDLRAKSIQFFGYKRMPQALTTRATRTLTVYE